jgi:hypothetical protein
MKKFEEIYKKKRITMSFIFDEEVELYKFRNTINKCILDNKNLRELYFGNCVKEDIISVEFKPD